MEQRCKMESKGDISEFNALVEKCAGSSRKDQLSFLERVIMKLMIKQYGKGDVIPDSLGAPELEALAKKEPATAMQILSCIYSYMSSLVLDNNIVAIRSQAVSIMQDELNRRQKIQQEANV